MGHVLTQGTGKEPTLTSVIQEHQKATKSPALNLPALLASLSCFAPPVLPSFSTRCQYHSLVILNKARSHSAYFNVFYLTDSFPLKVTQEQNLSDGALLAASPSSVWSTNRKIASIFKIRKKYVHTNVLRQTVLGTWITICL